MRTRRRKPRSGNSPACGPATCAARHPSERSGPRANRHPRTPQHGRDASEAGSLLAGMDASVAPRAGGGAERNRQRRPIPRFGHVLVHDAQRSFRRPERIPSPSLGPTPVRPTHPIVAPLAETRRKAEAGAGAHSVYVLHGRVRSTPDRGTECGQITLERAPARVAPRVG